MERDPESQYINMGARLYDPVIGRFLSVDPLWEAFRSFTPYHYAYNSPISYKDPSGLAPKKEKGDRVMGYTVYEPYIQVIVIDEQAFRAELYDWLSGLENFNAGIWALFKAQNNGLFAGIGTPGGGGGTGKPSKNDRTASDESNFPESGDATKEYQNDPSESTVLDDIPEKERQDSWNQTKSEQNANNGIESGGWLYKYINLFFCWPIELQSKKGQVDLIKLRNMSDNHFPEHSWLYEPFATYHGHTNDPRIGQYPNYTDLNQFTTNPALRDIRYHITYITVVPMRVYVWDNFNNRGYNFSPSVWTGR